MLKGLVLGIVLGVLLVLAGVYFYFSSGRVPVATNAPEMPLERKFAATALHAYLDQQPHPNPQVAADEPNFLAGAKVYKDQCAVCHGLPGEPKTMVADGMFPKPPQLFRGVGVTDDEPWETFVKVESGIRMTGMPGFKEHLSDRQMWQVSVLLKHADGLPPTVKDFLTGDTPAPPAVTSVAPATPAPSTATVPPPGPAKK
ncbi:MAG TPA: cytochrome c [Candidatus Dormibacteraeota bacterium]|nr:cytochrome c [Candidatus Dormibacteraeota bacterium]